MAEAISIENDLKDAARGRRAALQAHHGSTVEDLFDDYLGWYRIRRSPRTSRDLALVYEAHLKRLLGKEKVESLNNAHISLYQRLRHAEYTRAKAKDPKRETIARKTVSNRTINKELDYFRGFLKWCRTEKGIETSIGKISVLPESRPIPTVLSPKEMRAILKAADPFHRAMILCLYSLGLRMDEARNIRVEDIDFQNKRITVRQKGGSFKLLPLPQTLLSALKRIVDSGASSKANALIFPSKRQKKDDRDGERKPVYDIRTALKRICEKAGVTKRVYPHIFRHSCATHLMGSGVNVRIIQGYLGHAQISTTEFYTHVAASHLAGAADMMEGILRTGKTGKAAQTPVR